MADADNAALWEDGANRMRTRIDETAAALDSGFPHWANADTGKWTTTPDGDWTGGAWPGMLWLAHRATGEQNYLRLARTWAARMRPRALRETAFKGFGFYCGNAVGEILTGDAEARALALEAAASLRARYDERLGLIPLGREAEEHAEVGTAVSSIDSLQATPLLFWAAAKTGEASYRDCAVAHTSRVLDLHMLDDGSVIQSTELDAGTGVLRRRFTHKGYSDTSVWGRAQAWAALYAAMALIREPWQTRWMQQGQKILDWWLDHVPDSGVAFWDFSDPAIPDTETDTAATSIVCAALLKFAGVAPAREDRARYVAAARHSAASLVTRFVTPVGSADKRPPGRLVGACFNKRPDARPQDSASNVETIFGDYFLFEALCVLTTVVKAHEI